MPDLYMPEHVIEHLRADVHRLQDAIRAQRDVITQLNSNLARLADENRDANYRLARMRAGGKA